MGLPSNSFKPITNTAWVCAPLCKLQKRVYSTRSRKFTSCLPMVGGSLRVLQLLPPLKLVPWYSLSAAESGVKHNKSNIPVLLRFKIEVRKSINMTYFVRNWEMNKGKKQCYNQSMILLRNFSLNWKKARQIDNLIHWLIMQAFFSMTFFHKFFLSCDTKSTSDNTLSGLMWLRLFLYCHIRITFLRSHVAIRHFFYTSIQHLWLLKFLYKRPSFA